MHRDHAQQKKQRLGVRHVEKHNGRQRQQRHHVARFQRQHFHQQTQTRGEKKRVQYGNAKSVETTVFPHPREQHEETCVMRSVVVTVVDDVSVPAGVPLDQVVVVWERRRNAEPPEEPLKKPQSKTVSQRKQKALNERLVKRYFFQALVLQNVAGVRQY